MAVLKVIEIMSNSEKSWEDAARKGIEKASKSVKNIRSAWLKDQSMTVNEKGEIKDFRVILKVTFEVE
ncbi:MAG: hypothetical protein KatS3mg029_0605 [Saprospiraceae bacterium]|nr:MAG: hypothetical protein KatS3mg029_0605 [Saprospiraceae bacterium]